MASRASSLQNNTVTGIARDIGSQYDDVVAVKNALASIVKAANGLDGVDDINAFLANYAAKIDRLDLSGLANDTEIVEFGQIKADIGTAIAHTLNEAGHDYLNQDVTTEGTPTFASVQLSGGEGTQGTMSWNVDEETLDLVQNGAVLQLGQEVQSHCTNKSGATIANGTVVAVVGSLGSSGKLLVAPYTNLMKTTSILGIATEDITNDGNGKITKFGKVRGIDTSAFDIGDVLYAVGYGELSNVVPATGPIVPIAVVVTVSNEGVSNGTIMVIPTPVDETSVTRRFDTVADMEAQAAPAPYAWCSGKETAGDMAFGSHVFKWEPTLASGENYGTIRSIAAEADGRYILQYDGPVKLKWFDNADEEATWLAAATIGPVEVEPGSYNFGISPVIDFSGYKFYAFGNVSTNGTNLVVKNLLV